MGEDFVGQKRQQDLFQYSMTGSLVVALISGWFFQSLKTGWHAYLIGLFFTWLLNIVEWEYWFHEPTSWAEGRYLDSPGYWELEKMAAMNNHLAAFASSPSPSSSSSSSSSPKLQQRAQITLSGGPARMTISSRPPSPLSRFKKW